MISMKNTGYRILHFSYIELKYTCDCLITNSYLPPNSKQIFYIIKTNSFNPTGVEIKQVANINDTEPDGEERLVHVLIETAV